MDKHSSAVLFSLALYLLYVLIPLIPTILIYKFFPDEKVTASGVFSNFKFNAAGAFAAYVVTVFLGFFLVNKIHQQICQISNPTWTVKAVVDLTDPAGNQLNRPNLMETLNVLIDPELKTTRGNKVILKLPGDKTSWATTMIKFEIPRFGWTTIDLSEVAKTADIDEYDLVMTLDKPICIKAEEEYLRNYNAIGVSLQPMQSSGPPPRALPDSM